MVEKFKKQLLTPEQRKVNAQIACREHRERMKSAGYKAMQFWVPDSLREDVRAVVREMVEEFEKK